MKDTYTFNRDENEHKCWTDSFSKEFRKCPYCGSNWYSEFTQNIFVNFCPKCGRRVFKERDKEEITNESIRAYQFPERYDL